MPSRYHPIEEGLWDDEKFDANGDRPEAPGDLRGFYAFLASNKMVRCPGLYRATDGELAAAYRWPVRRVSEALADLHWRGLIVRDCGWVFLPGYLKRQANNPSVLKASKSTLDLCGSNLVHESFAQHYPLYSSWCRHGADTVTTPHSKLKNHPTPEHPTPEHPTPPHNTSPRQLPEEATWGTPEALALKYNRETTDNCPNVTTIRTGTALREKALRYLRTFPDEDWWTTTFRQYHHSKFLSGQSQPSNGHESFRPDLAWLLSKGKDGADNVLKVHDGRYRDG